jgi:hypothetical protein
VGTRPEQDQTPTYEGRRLARPHEELVDQGLRFDVGTLLSRRRMLAVLGIGTAGLGLAACGVGTGSSASSAASSSGTPASGEIPDETAGPFPVTVPTARTCSSRAASSGATSGPASGDRAGPRRASP